MQGAIGFVGIRNYPEKAELLKSAKPEFRELPTAELAYDCLRHIEFLEGLRDGLAEDAFPTTLYWKFLVSTGKPPQGALARCLQLRDLYEEVRARGMDYSYGYIAVTEDGMRLNGSRRASVAQVLGISELWVEMYRWEDRFPPWRVRHIREEARLKRQDQARFVGRRAFDPLTERSLGWVVMVDAAPTKRWSRFRLKAPKLQRLVMVRDDNGDLRRYPLTQVELR